jgi:flagellar P-ring protein precursor FlgI
MTKKAIFLCLFLLSLFVFSVEAFAGSPAAPAPARGVERVGDLTRVKNEDVNYAQGIGLVVGLDGTGDTQSPAAGGKFHNLLARYRAARNLTPKDLASKNIAFVTVQAKLEPNMKVGDRVDITVASAGTAKSLKGGILLQTYLQGPFQKTTGKYGKDITPPHLVWVQGRLGVDDDADSKTNGMIKQGGIVLEEIPSTIYDEKTRSITLVLNHPDHVMASQIEKAINGAHEQLLPVGSSRAMKLADAMDSKEIRIKVPRQYVTYEGNKPKLNNEFVARIMKVNVTVEEPEGKILIDKKNNGIWITGYVIVTEAAFSYKDVSIRIQPPAAAGAAAQPPTQAKNIIHKMPKGTDQQPFTKVGIELQKLISTLNELEVKTEDVIGIIEGLHKARAIKAKIEYMEN